MSKGLGKIERFIQTLVDKDLRDSDWFVAIRGWDVKQVFHPGYNEMGYDKGSHYSEEEKQWVNQWEPSRSQEKSVTRALHSFVRKNPRFALAGGKGRKGLFLYDTETPLSEAWARASVATRGPVARCEARKWLS